MKLRTALAYASGMLAGGVVGQMWRMYAHPGVTPELGNEGAFIGLLLFAILFAVVIYTYGEISGYVREDDGPESAYLISAIVGLPFWYIILPLHKFVNGQLNFPDDVWWIEAILLCAASFEIIRFLDQFWRTRKDAQ